MSSKNVLKSIKKDNFCPKITISHRPDHSAYFRLNPPNLFSTQKKGENWLIDAYAGQPNFGTCDTHHRPSRTHDCSPPDSYITDMYLWSNRRFLTGVLCFPRPVNFE